MDEHEFGNLIKVVKISFFGGLFVYLPFMTIILWVALPFSGTKHAIINMFVLIFIFYIIVPLTWLGSIIFITKNLKREHFCKVPLIVLLGSLTFLVCMLLLFKLISDLNFLLEYNFFFMTTSILILYPLVYGSYYWLFNYFLAGDRKG